MELNLHLKNEYWNNKKEGIYVDKISGTPLFLSIKKIDSNTGWPSFSEPININDLLFLEDNSFNMKRIEVKCKSGSHLGHVFEDNFYNSEKRYCINSASIDFIPKENLKNSKYKKFLKYFN